MNIAKKIPLHLFLSILVLILPWPSLCSQAQNDALIAARKELAIKRKKRQSQCDKFGENVLIYSSSIIISYFCYKNLLQQNDTWYLGVSIAIPACVWTWHTYTPYKDNNFYKWEEKNNYMKKGAMLINPLMSLCLTTHSYLKLQKENAELDAQILKSNMPQD